MIQRKIKPILIQALQSFRAVMISGPRQSGKTTLSKEIAKELNLEYITLDDLAKLEFATNDPENFIKIYCKKPVVIDEVQFAPNLIPYIKMHIDSQNQNGMFLLTGSADFYSVSKIHESLAGRMVGFKLFTLSSNEIDIKKHNIIDALFQDDILGQSFDIKNLEDLLKIICMGGYPRVLDLDIKDRDIWFESYIESRIKKDILEISNIIPTRVEYFNKLLGILSNQIGSLVSFNNIGKKLGVDTKTAQSYVSILKSMFLISELKPYFSNRYLSFVKMPKIFFNDTGLVCNILGIDQNTILQDKMYGHIVENFLYTELLKQSTFSEQRVKIYHLRNYKKQEVDFVLEDKRGELVLIECKAKSMIKKSDLKGTIEFGKSLKVKKSFVFYTGNEIRPYSIDGNLIYLLPLGLL